MLKHLHEGREGDSPSSTLYFLRQRLSFTFSRLDWKPSGLSGAFVSASFRAEVTSMCGVCNISLHVITLENLQQNDHKPFRTVVISRGEKGEGRPW